MGRQFKTLRRVTHTAVVVLVALIIVPFHAHAERTFSQVGDIVPVLPGGTADMRFRAAAADDTFAYVVATEAGNKITVLRIHPEFGSEQLAFTAAGGVNNSIAYAFAQPSQNLLAVVAPGATAQNPRLFVIDTDTFTLKHDIDLGTDQSVFAVSIDVDTDTAYVILERRLGSDPDGFSVVTVTGLQGNSPTVSTPTHFPAEGCRLNGATIDVTEDAATAFMVFGPNSGCNTGVVDGDGVHVSQIDLRNLDPSEHGPTRLTNNAFEAYAVLFDESHVYLVIMDFDNPAVVLKLSRDDLTPVGALELSVDATNLTTAVEESYAGVVADGYAYLEDRDNSGRVVRVQLDGATCQGVPAGPVDCGGMAADASVTLASESITSNFVEDFAAVGDAVFVVSRRSVEKIAVGMPAAPQTPTVIVEQPLSVPADLLELSCTPAGDESTVTVTCDVAGGTEGMEVLWQARINPPVASGIVTLDAAGTATFELTVPPQAEAAQVVVQLFVAFPQSNGATFGVTATLADSDEPADAETVVPLPNRVPAGDGPSGTGAGLVVLFAAALAVLGVRLKRQLPV